MPTSPHPSPDQEHRNTHPHDSQKRGVLSRPLTPWQSIGHLTAAKIQQSPPPNMLVNRPSITPGPAANQPAATTPPIHKGPRHRRRRRHHPGLHRNRASHRPREQPRTGLPHRTTSRRGSPARGTAQQPRQRPDSNAPLTASPQPGYAFAPSRTPRHAATGRRGGDAGSTADQVRSLHDASPQKIAADQVAGGFTPVPTAAANTTTATTTPATNTPSSRHTPDPPDTQQRTAAPGASPACPRGPCCRRLDMGLHDVRNAPSLLAASRCAGDVHASDLVRPTPRRALGREFSASA